MENRGRKGGQREAHKQRGSGKKDGRLSHHRAKPIKEVSTTGFAPEYRHTMTPAARLAAVIEILGENTAQPLDRQMKAWFRGHRFAGSGDRRAITERVYDIVRHRAHLAHRMGG
jgi:hypothetical protein